MPVPLTCEPGGVDVVCAVAVAAGAEEDPVAVGGQQVGAAVLALVADLQRSAVLRLTSVVRAHKLTRKIFYSTAKIFESTRYFNEVARSTLFNFISGQL